MNSNSSVDLNASTRSFRSSSLRQSMRSVKKIVGEKGTIALKQNEPQLRETTRSKKNFDMKAYVEGQVQRISRADSRCSVRSTNSVKEPMISARMTASKDMIQQSSRSSSRSLRGSMDVTKSNDFMDTNKLVKIKNRMKAMSFQGFSNEIDGLLHRKTEMLASGNQSAHLTLQEQIENQLLGKIDKELEIGLELLRSGHFDEELHEIYGKVGKYERKIELLQKILAELSTQGYVKKYQFSGIANKLTEYKALCNHELKRLMLPILNNHKKGSLISKSTSNYVTMEESYSQLTASAHLQKIPYNSTNNETYARHAQQCYNPARTPKKSYIRKNHMTPSSTYKVNYIKYPPLNSVHVSGKTNESVLQPHLAYSPKHIESSYEQAYNNTKKKSAIEDFKKLDCYRDKFKQQNVQGRDIPVRIFKESPTEPVSVGLTKLQKQYSKIKEKPDIAAVRGFQGQFMSEMRRQYCPSNRKQRSYNLNQRLQSKKYEWRRLLRM